MAKVYRKGETEAREIEVFELDLSERDQAEMRADPEGFFRRLLEPEIGTVNGVSIDVRIMNNLASGVPIAGPHVVHHTVSGQWQSKVEVTDPM
ncbi:hypothetical protein [Streptomyces sp. NPDC051776]|uniref:hypothetical protein n=1 Tax=Streptomyces sp. NPDC051776 TaxID=3155414 RepID=UPI00341999FE